MWKQANKTQTKEKKMQQIHSLWNCWINLNSLKRKSREVRIYKLSLWNRITFISLQETQLMLTLTFTQSSSHFVFFYFFVTLFSNKLPTVNFYICNVSWFLFIYKPFWIDRIKYLITVTVTVILSSNYHAFK